MAPAATTLGANVDGTDHDNEVKTLEAIRKIRKRAPQPIGTYRLNQLRLLSPFTWWGVATIRKCDTRPILVGLAGILLPALVYQLTRGVLAFSGGATHAIGSSWTPLGGAVMNRSTGSNRPSSSSNLILPYLASPWTLGMIAHASASIQSIWLAIQQMLSGRSLSGLTAWQTLVDQVEVGRAYRTRKYDVYLPPSSAGTATEPLHAILLLPGSAVEHVAYSEPATLLSNAGYLVVVVAAEPLRICFPELGTTAGAIRRIQRSIERKHTSVSLSPTTRRAADDCKMSWSMLGHSLGSFTACQLAEEFCKEETTAISSGKGGKIVLWGVAPFLDYLPDLSGHQILPVLVVQASNDGIVEAFATEELTKQFWERLPKDTAELVIKGGTHSGFANYVSMWTKKEVSGIPREEQHRQAVQATVEFLQK